MLDVTTAGRRVLDELLYLSDPETGTVEISQNEMCAELGSSKPTVNRGFKELYACRLGWTVKDRFYQLHPLLTGGMVSSPVMPVPAIRAAEPERFTEQRWARFTAQSSSYVLGSPADALVTIPRPVLRLLALVDVTTAGRRVLDELLYLHDQETGTVEISQNEMCAELGSSKPTVNRGFKELRECGLTWSLEDGLYQLHPLLTGGKVSSPVMPVPAIRAAEPEGFTARRRSRYAAQTANLDIAG
ncbi:helix-turn-helix domain-containing protein [Streptomyces sp. NPDC004286]|uniref:helix-turn-helix domain-containing protein n=1 Tax=Streptomyces sp. NPDC004286 TaxID=3364696 RepID=UPI0036B09752